MKIFISYQIQGKVPIHHIVGRVDEFKWDIEGDLDTKDVIDKLHHNHDLTYETISPTKIMSSIVILSINMLPNIQNKWK